MKLSDREKEVAVLSYPHMTEAEAIAMYEEHKRKLIASGWTPPKSRPPIIRLTKAEVAQAIALRPDMPEEDAILEFARNKREAET